MPLRSSSSSSNESVLEKFRAPVCAAVPSPSRVCRGPKGSAPSSLNWYWNQGPSGMKTRASKTRLYHSGGSRSNVCIHDDEWVKRGTVRERGARSAASSQSRRTRGLHVCIKAKNNTAFPERARSFARHHCSASCFWICAALQHSKWHNHKLSFMLINTAIATWICVNKRIKYH